MRPTSNKPSWPLEGFRFATGDSVRQYIKQGVSIIAKDLDESHAPRKISTPPDPIGIIWIDLNSAWVGLGIGKWKLDPLARLGIEAGDFVGLLFTDPDQIILPVHAYG